MATKDVFEAMIHTYALCTLFIFTLYFGVLLYASNMAKHPPEDAKTFGAAPPVPVDFERRDRAFMNNVENIPLNVGIFWAALVVQCIANASGNGALTTQAITGLFIAYTVFRYLHTFCYLRGLQPHRTLSFLCGNCCVFSVLICLVAAAYECKVDVAFPGRF